jgi:hypothetical protein
MTRGNKAVVVGAGAGLVFGAAFGNAGLGMVVGAAVGLVLGANAGRARRP